MPELPEVENFRKYIDKTALRKQIQKVRLLAPRMLLNTSEKKLKARLLNNTFVSTFRHGKFLFVTTRTGTHLMLHFGLIGNLVHVEAGEDPPGKFVLQLYFEDDSSLYFTDTRKMGKIAVVDDVKEFIRSRRYGTDALKSKLPQFISQLNRRNAAIKTLLMDQKILAGVGNEFSDEILFQARIHPASHASRLSEALLEEIYTRMIYVLKKAVKHNADRDKLTQFFFLDNRKAGLTCPNCGGTTEHLTIGGRSSYFCPICQLKY